ncbi:MAG: hypothetical protein MZV63_47160 [Marinilabiliales bacterium]|nr:hypothetical protein [Marinilabiliales bacterium]
MPPLLLVVKLTAAVAVPLHLVWSAGSFTCPAGLTVMVKVSGCSRRSLQMKVLR